jgi:pyrroline-5-carboxylate reductase
MGIAVLSGVIDSLDLPSRLANSHEKWESHTPGTLTPVPSGSPNDKTFPSRFLACVKREQSAIELRNIFASNPTNVLAKTIEVFVSQNVRAVEQSDVVLLCCKPQIAYSILSEPGMKEALAGKLLISILAGVTISQLSDWVLPSAKVIRAMPNTPCKVCVSIL